ncbi:putative sugar phosphate isomerase involved in capsule formation [Thermoplasmatales archaeon BRNA1]|nr:putative sugar phosphate isomerase involved in capsule formation [Thermoplasmatales archaeon BRNA1]
MDPVGFLTEQCRNALSSVPEECGRSLIESIVSAERIFIFGVGRSGLVAQTFAIRLVQMGLRVYFVGDMTTPIIGKDDLLILVSNTGNTMSVVKTAQIAQGIGTRRISITANGKSSLAKTSDEVIVISASNPEAKDLAPLGTLFEDATFLFFDSLVPPLMKRLGVTEEDMRNNHAIWV